MHFFDSPTKLVIKHKIHPMNYTRFFETHPANNIFANISYIPLKNVDLIYEDNNNNKSH